MSVALFRIQNNDIYNSNAPITLSEPISSERFYLQHWEPAIREMKVKIFMDGSQFQRCDLDQVLSELERLREWAVRNLTNNDLKYMCSRIEHLQEIIPNSFLDDHTILYIF